MERVDVEKAVDIEHVEKIIEAPILQVSHKSSAGILVSMKKHLFFGLLGLIVLLGACSAEQELRVYSFTFPFISSDQGWSGGFANYPSVPVDSIGYHLHAAHDPLAYNINTDSTRMSMYISGNSLNNQLFMFLKRKITGLKPSATYEVMFTVRLASNLPTKQPTTPATLGELTHVRIGAMPEEPVLTAVDNVYRITLGEEILDTSGTQLLTIGSVAVTSSTKAYTMITRNNTSATAVRATTNEAGELWLVVGTQGTASGKVTLYYTQIDVLLNQVD